MHRKFVPHSAHLLPDHKVHASHLVLLEHVSASEVIVKRLQRFFVGLCLR